MIGSLASIKVKETKGRQNTLPKLKIVLANSSKSKCPTLNDNDLQELRQVLNDAINISGMDRREFAKSNHICLGLESSLRSINSSKSKNSCVLLSLSIKPRHLISLIARNAEVKDKQILVFAQPQLEEFLHDIFGVRAMAFVLPADLKPHSDGLHKWMTQQNKALRTPTIICKRKQTTTIKKMIKQKLKSPDQDVCQDDVPALIPVLTESPQQSKDKSWSGDFIGFSTSAETKMDALNVEDDKWRLLDALPQISGNVTDSKTLKCPTDGNKSSAEDLTPCDDQGAVSSDVDDFLQEYQPLTVHKILVNPCKKSKKKRKKNTKN